MDLDVTFDDRTMKTAVYIKMDAHDQLLLSEGVCRQLGIIAYHKAVEAWRGGRKKARQGGAGRWKEQGKQQGSQKPLDTAQVPTVRVRLVQSVRILPHHCAAVDVRCDTNTWDAGLLLFERDPEIEEATGLEVEDVLLHPTKRGRAQIILSNPSGYTQVVEEGLELGQVSPATVVQPAVSDDQEPVLPVALRDHLQGEVNRVTLEPSEGSRLQRLANLVGEPSLPAEEKQALLDLLSENHQAFCIDDDERGETDLVQLHIHTGDAAPKKQPVRRMPFAVRREVARQLQAMQAAGVIEPSNSPWASPVVMVRKKDGTHRFCVDYRQVNAVTRADTFPLPRIDDLLDQLGDSKYFSTLDLASGYWQIRVHADSQEKTAFVTPQGLFEFRVMPFGLTNAPAVFQRLMQRVLMGLNPEDGPDFVSVYIDDILVFSRTISEHLRHLQLVLERLKEAGLKLKPTKCHFIREEVEYLGHIITPQGLKPNPKLVAAVQEYPAPKNIRNVRQFLGLSSYYRRFIPQFARIAQPLHMLTRKGAELHWDTDCQSAFSTLQRKLSQAPVLAYPSFDNPFVLETDASIQGLGAVLSQQQDDRTNHPVAYASRALSASERN